MAGKTEASPGNRSKLQKLIFYCGNGPIGQIRGEVIIDGGLTGLSARKIKNILLIDLSFLFLIFYIREFSFLKNKVVIYLLLLYWY